MGQENLWKWGVVALIIGLGTWMSWTILTGDDESPFGGPRDVAFAQEVWEAMSGYTEWQMVSEVKVGGSPHGAFVRLYYNTIQVDGENYHVIAKDNFGGEGASIESISASPTEYLAAITVMVQCNRGYDPENDDWYWVKYLPDGSLDVNAAGIPLAGRVAKGADTGCIACHTAADGGDYLFSNDP